MTAPEPARTPPAPARTGLAVPPYRLLVTASRTWRNRSLIHRVLSGVHQAHPDAVLVSGHCPEGGDLIAERHWAVLCGYPTAAAAIDAGRIEAHPAQWRLYQKRSGPIRNAEMVSAGADECVAFIMPCADRACPSRGAHDSHGAGGCAALALDAGIPTRQFRPGSRP
jgi:SLOG family YspA-like protein